MYLNNTLRGGGAIRPCMFMQCQPKSTVIELFLNGGTKKREEDTIMQLGPNFAAGTMLFLFHRTRYCFYEIYKSPVAQKMPQQAPN